MKRTKVENCAETYVRYTRLATTSIPEYRHPLIPHAL
jgi:hypothetical protein